MKPIPSVFTIAAVVLTGASLALAWQTGERNDDRTTKEELAKLQGGWQLILKTRNGTIRSVKRVEGNQTTVTRFDENGAVITAHKSEFKLEITARVKIFTYFNVDTTTGRRKEPRSYIYTVDEDTWVEARGLLKDQPNEQPHLFVWTRVREKVAAKSERPRVINSCDRSLVLATSRKTTD